MNKYIVEFSTKEGKKGIAIVSADGAHTAETVVKYQGMFAQEGYIIDTVIEIDQANCENRILDEIALSK